MHRATAKIARPIAMLALAYTLAACATSSDRYPSLAVRDVERVEGRFTPVPPTSAPPALTAMQLQTLGQLREQARAAHARFVAAAPVTQRLITAARGASDTSNAFLDAQVALSELESLRSQTALALGDADSLYVEAAVEGPPADDLTQTRATIVDLVADEDTTLAALRGQIAR